MAAPKSVVVKMSRTDFKGRFLNLVMFLSREAHFFAEIGSDSQLSIPNVLVSTNHDPALRILYLNPGRQ